MIRLCKMTDFQASKPQALRIAVTWLLPDDCGSLDELRQKELLCAINRELRSCG